MKKLLIILLGVIFIVGGGVTLAGYSNGYNSPSTLKADEKKEPEGAKCPITTYTDQDRCEKCHEMRKEDSKWGWHIRPQKAKDPKRFFRSPAWIQLVNGEAEGYYEIDSVSATPFATFRNYMYEIGVKKITVDIFSGGGSLFDGISIVSQIMEMQSKGIKVTTQNHAFSASAAMVIFLAGDKRLVNSYSILMWHELKMIDWPKWSSPSDKEDEARVLRLIQDNMNRYMADRINTLEKDEIDKSVHRIEWWMTGKEAVELGIATGYIE